MDNFIPLNIKYLRSVNKLDQDELGEIMNVSRDSISSYEREKSMPTISSIQKLCDHFDITLDELVNTDLAKSNTKSESIIIIGKGFDPKDITDEQIQTIARIVEINKERFLENRTFGNMYELDVKDGVIDRLKGIIVEKGKS